MGKEKDFYISYLSLHDKLLQNAALKTSHSVHGSEIWAWLSVGPPVMVCLQVAIKLSARAAVPSEGSARG